MRHLSRCAQPFIKRKGYRRSPNVYPRKRPLHEHSGSNRLQEVSGKTEKPSKACARSSHLVGCTGEDRQLTASWAASGRRGRANRRCAGRDGHGRVTVDGAADWQGCRRAADRCDWRRSSGWHNGRDWDRSRFRDNWGKGAGLGNRGDGHWCGLGNDRRSWGGRRAVKFIS